MEDRRGMSGGKVAAGGGAGVLLIALVVMLLGGDPSAVLNQASQAGGSNRVATAEEESLKKFVSVVLKDTETVWTDLFAKDLGREYVKPKLVIFTDGVNTACGQATSASGPFYCGEDQKMYIDLGFYQIMKDQLKAGGDFAQAYVVAHEIGHHVQNQLGTLDKVHAMRERLSDKDYNKYSVRLELQADYYAGVWANHAARMAELDEGDIREAITAANAIGDDTLQRQAQGQVVPDAFTHGTSAQRVKWFMAGWKDGTIRGGDTFSARDL